MAAKSDKAQKTKVAKYTLLDDPPVQTLLEICEQYKGDWLVVKHLHPYKYAPDAPGQWP